MTGKPFRFAVQAAAQAPEQWLATTAKRAEEPGYSALPVPDGPQLLSPQPALAVAAGATRHRGHRTPQLEPPSGPCGKKPLRWTPAMTQR